MTGLLNVLYYWYADVADTSPDKPMTLYETLNVARDADAAPATTDPRHPHGYDTDRNG